LCFGHVTSPDGAASSLPPPKPRHGKHTGGAGYSVAEGGTQRADSTAPIAQQCQWFLSNLVAQYYAPGPEISDLSHEFSASRRLNEIKDECENAMRPRVADIGGDTRILRQVWHVPDRIDPA
jgi:hypothetical protein